MTHWRLENGNRTPRQADFCVVSPHDRSGNEKKKRPFHFLTSLNRSTVSKFSAWLAMASLFSLRYIVLVFLTGGVSPCSVFHGMIFKM